MERSLLRAPPKPGNDFYTVRSLCVRRVFASSRYCSLGLGDLAIRVVTRMHQFPRPSQVERMYRKTHGEHFRR